MFVKIEILIDRDGDISQRGLGEIDDAIGEACSDISHLGSVSLKTWVERKQVKGQLAEQKAVR